MKPRYLGRLLAGIELVILAGIVVHAPLSVGLGAVAPDQALLFKAWKEVLLGLAAGTAVMAITRLGKWRELSADLIIRLAAGYALLHLVVLAAMWQGLDASLAGLLIDLRYVLFFVLVYVTLQLFPGYRKLFIMVGIMGAAVVTGFALLQATVLPPDILKYIGYSQSTIMPYLTVDLNPDFVRINSTLRGPNPLGAYAGMVLAVIAAYVTQYQRRVARTNVILLTLLSTGALVALWASYSRSAIIAAVIMAVIVVAASSNWRVSRVQWTGAIAVMFVLIGGLFAARDTAFVSNVLLHENPDSTSQQKSNDGHIDSVNDGVRRVLARPLGEGVGSTGSASLRGDQPLIIENQYLSIAHEVGWVGLGLFVTLFGVILGKLWRRRDDWLALGLFASGVGLAVTGLLQPVWMDDTVSMVWWGMAAVALIAAKRESQHGKIRAHH